MATAGDFPSELMDYWWNCPSSRYAWFEMHYTGSVFPVGGALVYTKHERGLVLDYY